MNRTTLRYRLHLLAGVAMLAGAISVFAGSAVIGSVAGSRNATVGGQTLLPNTTLFSGDHVAVKDGAAVVAMGQGSRLVFGKETQATLEREADGVAVKLGEGTVSLFRPAAGAGLKVEVAGLTVAPGKGYKTVGEVAMLNGLVVVMAKEGALEVDGTGQRVEVTKGKSLTMQQSVADAPQNQGGGATTAGTVTSHWTQAEWMNIASVGAGGTSAVMAGIGISRANSAKSAAMAANTAATNAFNEATTAFNEATAAATAAQAACQAASPTSTCPGP